MASKTLKFSSKPIKAGGRLLRLTIETENCHINLQDTMAYLSGGLKKLCESFKLEKTSSKSEFLGHLICNAENYHLMRKGYRVENGTTNSEGLYLSGTVVEDLSLNNGWSDYLDLDVISLSIIWVRFVLALVGVNQMMNEKRIAEKYGENLQNYIEADPEKYSKEIDECVCVKKCISAASYSWKIFVQQNQEVDLYAFKDKYTRYFERRSVHGGIC
jgi:hypothetical protein